MRRSYILYFILILFASCSDKYEVKVMPEFNYADTDIQLWKNAGSEKTALLMTTEGDVLADYNCPWLSVDVSNHRIVYSTTMDNETGYPRSTNVHLYSGDYSVDVTVTQSNKQESENNDLEVGQLTDDKLGVIYWVSPENHEIGKAITLQRWPGSPYEATPKFHGATSTVNGKANTELYTDILSTDAPGICQTLGNGWYLPASGELIDIFNIYNGLPVDDINFKSVVPASLSVQEVLARATFDKMLTDLGGTPMNEAAETANGESYWSSTENSDGSKATYVRFGKYTQSDGSKNASSVRYVRAVKIIGDYVFPEEKATITIDPKEVSLGQSAGSSAEVTITSNKKTIEVAVHAEAASWLEAKVSDTKITMKTLTANDNEKARQGTVTVTVGEVDNTTTADITVTQAGKPHVKGFSLGDEVEGGIVYWVDPTDNNKAKIASLKRYSLAWTDVTPPSGWSFPTKEEMADIFKIYNGGGKTTVDVPANITDNEKAARAKFDAMFTDHGGDAWNQADPTASGDSYWTSTDYADDNSKAMYVRFGKYLVSYSKKTGNRFVRYIKNISK